MTMCKNVINTHKGKGIMFELSFSYSYISYSLEDFAAVNDAWRLSFWDLVAPGPEELHLVGRVEDALDVEVTHGRVKGKDVEVALAVQD